MSNGCAIKRGDIGVDEQGGKPEDPGPDSIQHGPLDKLAAGPYTGNTIHHDRLAEGSALVDTLLSQTNGDVLVVYFTDTNLTAAPRIDAVGEALTEAMNRAAHGKLLLNFQAVRAMASKMFGKLVKLHKDCAAAKIDLKLCQIADPIMEGFRVTQLHKVFDIHPDESSALKAFSKRSWFARR